MLNNMPLAAHNVEPQENANSLLVFMSHERPELLEGRWTEAFGIYDWINFGIEAIQSAKAVFWLKDNGLLQEKSLDGKAFYRLSDKAIEMIASQEVALVKVS